MKIKAFSFERNEFDTALLKQNIASQLTESGVFFESINAPDKLFTAISDALETADVILIGSEDALYLKFKPVLIKAFNFTPAYSEKIDKAIGNSVSDEKIRKAHTLVPNECTELITKDGLNSGFYVKSSNQCIVVFPLTEGVVPDILTKSDLPFFKSPEKRAALLKEISDEDKASSMAEELVAKLRKHSIKLAIPSTPAAKTLKDDIKSCEDYENLIFFTPFVNDEGVSEPKEYSAQLAKGAMDLRNADLGATVSNIFREVKGDKVTSYYSFVSVATADKIVIKKLFANGDESVENLILEATVELYAMIDKYLDEVIFKKTATAEEKEKYEKSLIEAEYQADQRPAASIGKKGTIAAIIGLAIAVIVCVVLGLSFGGYFVTPSDAPEEQSLQAGNTVQSTEQTLPSTTLGIPALTENEITELTSEEGSTSIFDIDPTKPVIVTGNNTPPTINYTPNTNTGPVTTAPATTEPTTQPVITQAPTTQPQTTEEQFDEEW